MEQLTNIREAVPSPKSFREMAPMARREMRNGLTFISPWIIGFILFTTIPMVATFIFSFLDLRITDGVFNPLRWVGLENYATMFSDPKIWTADPNTTPGALWVTLRFGLLALPFGIFLPLGLALLLNNKNLRASSLFRSLFYMPYIVPFVAAVFIWNGMLNPQTGWINTTLVALGVPRGSLPTWANDIHWVYPAYIILGLWGVGNAMLTFTAGLQAVPSELYDAAKVDGAGPWATFANITFPMISPVVFYNLILTVVGLFQYFLVPLALNQGTGNPGGATMFFNLYLYKTFFTYQNMSYGATLAWLLFIFVMIVTIILFATARYWVYYASDRR